MARATSAALALLGLFIGFVALSGFLFGQLFFGHFSISSSMAGLAGIACSIAAFRMASHRAWARPWVIWVCLTALLGVLLDAANYYIYLAIPGNYYAWALIGPFAASVAFVAFTARRRSSLAGKADALYLPPEGR